MSDSTYNKSKYWSSAYYVSGIISRALHILTPTMTLCGMYYYWPNFADGKTKHRKVRKNCNTFHVFHKKKKYKIFEGWVLKMWWVESERAIIPAEEGYGRQEEFWVWIVDNFATAEGQIWEQTWVGVTSMFWQILNVLLL